MGGPLSFALPQPGRSPRRWTTELEFDYLPPVLIILTHWLGFSTWVRSGISLRIRVTPEVAVSHVYMGGTHVAALVPDPRLRACLALIQVMNLSKWHSVQRGGWVRVNLGGFSPKGLRC